MENNNNEQKDTRLFCENGHFSQVNCIQVLSETNRFISGGNDKLVLVWDFQGKLCKKVSIFKSEVMSFASIFRPSSVLKSSDFLDKRDYKKFLENPFQKFESQETQKGGIVIGFKKSVGRDFFCEDHMDVRDAKEDFLSVLQKCSFAKMMKKSGDTTGEIEELKESNEDVEKYKEKIRELERINQKLLQICCDLDN